MGQHDESGRKEHAIYLSKKFRRLRQYMLVHTTLWISKMDPIKYVNEKPVSTGWVVKEQTNVY